MEKAHCSITPKAPFDFDLTAGYHTYFQGHYGTDSLDQGVYRRLLDLNGSLVLASVRSVGSVDSPELSVELRGSGLTPERVDLAAKQIGWLLGVDQDLAPFYDLARQDPAMAAVTGQFHGLHLPHTATVFEALVLGILGQQIATNVARIIRTLLIETYGPRGLFDKIFDGESNDEEPFFAFPRPEALAACPVAELRGMKLSWRKAEYVQGVAAEFAGGTDMERATLEVLGDEEVVNRVTQLRGVGRWTAQWLLIRALGRPDALPLGDLALRRVVSRLYFSGEPVDDAQVEEFCIPWSPWRSYATVYWFTALRRGMA